MPFNPLTYESGKNEQLGSSYRQPVATQENSHFEVAVKFQRG
jgi:hypothetical protein